AAHYHIALRPERVGKPCTWPDVIVASVYQALGARCLGERECGRIKIADAVVYFVIEGQNVPPHSEIQGQVGRSFPVVLNIKSVFNVMKLKCFVATCHSTRV